jgi:hypothetical protein
VIIIALLVRKFDGAPWGRSTIGLRVSGQGFDHVVPRIGAPSLAAKPQVLRVECDGTSYAARCWQLEMVS